MFNPKRGQRPLLTRLVRFQELVSTLVHGGIGGMRCLLYAAPLPETMSEAYVCAALSQKRDNLRSGSTEP